MGPVAARRLFMAAFGRDRPVSFTQATVDSVLGSATNTSPPMRVVIEVVPLSSSPFLTSLMVCC